MVMEDLRWEVWKGGQIRLKCWLIWGFRRRWCLEEVQEQQRKQINSPQIKERQRQQSELLVESWILKSQCGGDKAQSVWPFNLKGNILIGGMKIPAWSKHSPIISTKSVVRILIIKAFYFSTHFQAAMLEENYYAIHISRNFSKELKKNPWLPH